MRAQQCATNRNEKGDFLLLRQFRMAMKFSKEKEGGREEALDRFSPELTESC